MGADNVRIKIGSEADMAGFDRVDQGEIERRHEPLGGGRPQCRQDAD